MCLVDSSTNIDIESEQLGEQYECTNCSTKFRAIGKKVKCPTCESTHVKKC